MRVAKWEGVIIAESDQCVEVEGNQYVIQPILSQILIQAILTFLLSFIQFPVDAIKMEYFKPADNTTVCGWKGTANYYDLHVNGMQKPLHCIV